MKWAFLHIHEYYSPQNISTIKYLFMKKCLENKNDNFQENLSWPGTGPRPGGSETLLYSINTGVI
jgi:hypothetical protein